MTFLRLFLLGAMLLVQGCPVSPFSRTKEFEAKAREGQPLVRAIEAFHKDTGNYPATLAELVPKYLPSVPDKADSSHKWGGWEYVPVTNYDSVSYVLDLYMGKGFVMYTGTNWIGDDDGHRTVLSVQP